MLNLGLVMASSCLPRLTMAEVLIRHGTKNVWCIAVLEQKDSSAISNFLRFDACSRAFDFLKSYLAKQILG